MKYLHIWGICSRQGLGLPASRPAGQSNKKTTSHEGVRQAGSPLSADLVDLIAQHCNKSCSPLIRKHFRSLLLKECRKSDHHQSHHHRSENIRARRSADYQCPYLCHFEDDYQTSFTSTPVSLPHQPRASALALKYNRPYTKADKKMPLTTTPPASW